MRSCPEGLLGCKLNCMILASFASSSNGRSSGSSNNSRSSGSSSSNSSSSGSSSNSYWYKLPLVTVAKGHLDPPVLAGF